MVVNRFLIHCATCQQNHTLRITVGTDKYQEHSFPCVNCGEDISVRLDVDFEIRKQVSTIPGLSIPSTKLSTLKNCDFSEKEGTIVNLSPNFLISEELRHDATYFPSIFQSMELIKKLT
ncbi:hypothetical protein SPB21_35175 [Leptothoe sp. ISB3NOV94-8A]